MCGITGFIDFNNKITKQQLVNACNTLSHRGPDDSDTVVIESNNAHVGLGHRRLSILDISSLGHQPMYSDDRSVVIVLNGEIYNFKEVRSRLETKGYSFRSNSDTEVVIKAYQEYGMDCLEQFIGMFAFVLYDSGKQKVYLVRDRAGVKPLYYYFAGGNLLFASELKALHQYPYFKKTIDPVALSLYFSYGYIKAPYSIFKDTHKLLPGHFAVIDLNRQSLELQQYWNVVDHYNKPEIRIDEQEAIQHLDELCNSAFQYRMVSDVPVGVFLSGGYDSSLVAAILQKNSRDKIKTYTIGFKEDKYNEAVYAKQVAQHIGTDHNEYYCSTKEALEIIPFLPYYYDEPFGDSSAIPTILVSRFAKKEVTVALSADAGDEIFAGYNRYDQLTKIKKIKQYLPSFAGKASAMVLRQLPGNRYRNKRVADILSSGSDLAVADMLSRQYTINEVDSLLNTQRPVHEKLVNPALMPFNRDYINTILAADYTTYMVDDILTKVDRATMSVGLEGREPLLDHRIIEWAAQLPSSLKYNKGNKKYLLKQLAHRYLPEAIMNRPKMGFGIPVNKWLKGDLKELVVETISKENLERHNLLNTHYTLQLRDDYLSNNSSSDNSQLWLILMFQLWWKEWMQ